MSNQGERVSGIDLGNGGMTFDFDSAGIQITDPDDPQRIIVVPLSAVTLVFHRRFRELGQITAAGQAPPTSG